MNLARRTCTALRLQNLPLAGGRVSRHLPQPDALYLLTEGWQADGNNTFFAVGDPMQSSRFRDADISLFAKCREQPAGLPLEPLDLVANFRSVPICKLVQ